MKNFKGKAIYNPSGKAGEYSYWACNFYVGCSNGCTYCYLKKGRGANILGGNKPELKKCFKDEKHAIEIFEKELIINMNEIKKHGLFFSFTTDPLIIETKRLTIMAVRICNNYKIPVKVLTKEAGYTYLLGFASEEIIDYSLIAVGFTLTGHDELECNVSSNNQRIEALRIAKETGYKTFASVEPIIDFESSYKMIEQSMQFCDLYKIGLESGGKYTKNDCLQFIVKVNLMLSCRSNAKAYWKESVLKKAEFPNEALQEYFRCTVERDYNMFK